MDIKSLVAWAMVGLVASSPVSAIPLTGVFSGRATGDFLDGFAPTGEAFNAAPVTGTFTFETDISPQDAQAVRFEDSLTYFYFGPTRDIRFAIDLLGLRITQPADAASFAVELDGGEFGGPQTLTIGAAMNLVPPGEPFSGISLTLFADSGLFSNFDLNTLDLSQVDFINSGVSFSAFDLAQGSIKLERVMFAAAGTAVPVPGSLLLMLIGCVPLALRLSKIPERESNVLATCV